MEIKDKFSISIIGAGRLGGALAIALARENYLIQSVVARSNESAARAARQIMPAPEILTAENIVRLSASDIIFITTPDPEIEPTAARLAAQGNFDSETIFLHTSGSLSSAVLGALKETGASVGSLHPLVSVSESRAGAELFAGAFFCVEGDERAVAAAKQIVADLGGESFEINPEFKTLYHAAAVMTAGHLVALFDVAAETLSHCGVGKAEARRILLPLARSSVANLGRQTPAQALTGTFARADVQTMHRHLESLSAEETALSVYTELGKRSIKLAREQGADDEKLEEMLGILVNRES